MRRFCNIDCNIDFIKGENKIKIAVCEVKKGENPGICAYQVICLLTNCVFLKFNIIKFNI